MSEVPSRIELLSAVYAGAVQGEATATWDDIREAKRIERHNNLEAWGQELRASTVGQLIMACDGLESGRGSSQGQHDDRFNIKPGDANTLSLHYLNPANTTWMGELITADLAFSNEGDEVWGLKFLNGVYKEPQIIGGFEHGTRNVGVYERTEFQNEQDATDFLLNYIQTHDCAQTLRQVIGRNVRLAEHRKAQAGALTAEAK